MKLLIIILLSFFTISVIAQDVTIYVSPHGKGNGANSSPTSLNAAMTMLSQLKQSNHRCNVTVILKNGEYALTEPLVFNIQNGGTESFKITFKADVNAKPILSGGKKMLLKGDQVLRADVSELLKNDFRIEDIYINGLRGDRAKTPNKGFFRFTKTSEIIDTLHKEKNQSLQSYEIQETLAQELRTLSASEIKKVRFRIYHKWDNTMRTIDSVDKSKPVFYSTGMIWKNYNVIDSKSIFYLENYKQAFDYPNEWFIDGNVLNYIPVNPKTKQQEIIVPTIEKFIIIKGDSSQCIRNISFQGISFQYVNKKFEGYESSQAAASIDAAIMLDDAQNIQFENCEIQHTGQYAIWFNRNVKNSGLKFCLLKDLGAGGVRIGETSMPTDKNNYTSNITIEDCIIQSGGHNYPSGIGIFIAHSANNIISHNDIGDFRYSGVSVGWVWGYAYSPSVNNKIINNHIHHLGRGVLSDMAAVYTLGVSDGTEVSNNCIHDVYSYDYGGWGLYADEGSSHIHMENNLVYNTKTGSFHQHYGEGNLIQNNIFAFSKNYLAQDSKIENHTSFSFKRNLLLLDGGVMLQGCWKNGKVDIDSNCYWFAKSPKNTFMISTMEYGSAPRDTLTFVQWQKISGRDQHSIFEDPGFVDATHFNFKLINNSILNKIGFVPFDYSNAGVRGTATWEKLAILPKPIVEEYFESIRLNMQK